MNLRQNNIHTFDNSLINLVRITPSDQIPLSLLQFALPIRLKLFLLFSLSTRLFLSVGYAFLRHLRLPSAIDGSRPRRDKGKKMSQRSDYVEPVDH